MSHAAETEHMIFNALLILELEQTAMGWGNESGGVYYYSCHSSFRPLPLLQPVEDVAK